MATLLSPTVTFRRIPRAELLEIDVRKRLDKLGVFSIG